MHEPDLLVLDEPTSGLDPLVQETFFELVGEVTGRGWDGVSLVARPLRGAAHR